MWHQRDFFLSLPFSDYRSWDELHPSPALLQHIRYHLHYSPHRLSLSDTLTNRGSQWLPAVRDKFLTLDAERFYPRAKMYPYLQVTTGCADTGGYMFTAADSLGSFQPITQVYRLSRY